MTLAELVTSALLYLRPIEADRARLAAFGQDIAAVVEEHAEVEEWLGDPMPHRARERTALALVAVAYHESALREDVATCQVVGTDHPSITAFQLWGSFAYGGLSRSELCRSPRQAARRALAVLAHHGRCGEERAFWGYASGRCNAVSAAAKRQIALWRRLVVRFAP
jgi:hypothetical protein